MGSVDTLVFIYSVIMTLFSILVVLISLKIFYFEVFLDKSRFFKTLEARLPKRVITLLRIAISTYTLVGALLSSYLVYRALTPPLELFIRSGYEMYDRDPQLFLTLTILGLLVIPIMYAYYIQRLVKLIFELMSTKAH
jgi:hypothetical protein